MNTYHIASLAGRLLNEEGLPPAPSVPTPRSFIEYGRACERAAYEKAARWFDDEDNRHLFFGELLYPHQVSERLRKLGAQIVSDNDMTFVRDAALVLQNICHGAARDAGWWVNPKTGEHVADNPLAFSNKLMLTVSELAEAMEGDRKGLSDDKLPHRPMREVELADAVIRIFDMAGGFGLDLPGAIMEKLHYNATRPDHKPENRVKTGGKVY